ncbi:hypothetical protein ACIBJE_20270 [Micromonospora sp. NPDC050187]
MLAWVDVVTASGTAGPEEISAATEVSLAHFAPDVATPDRQS